MKTIIKSYPIPLAFLGLTCTIALALALANKDSFQALFLNSDTMYLPSIYRDLIMDNGAFEKWSFNAAPNLYPDFIVFSGLMSLFNDTITTTISFGILQYLLFVFLTGNIVHTAITPLSLHQKALGILLAGLPFTALIFHRDVEFTFQLLSNAYHLGASISTLIALRIFIQIFNKNQWWWWPVFLIHITLAGANDKLFWIQCLVPLFILGIILFFQKKIKLATPLLLTIIAAFVMANTYLNSHREPANPTIERAFREFAFSYTKESALHFFTDLKMVFGCFDTKSFFYFVALAFGLGSSIFVLKKKLEVQKTKITVLFFVAASTYLTIAAPILNGNYISYEHHRYFIGALLISFLTCVFILITQIKAEGISKVLSVVSSVVIVIFFVINISFFREKINLYPPFAKEVDTLIEKYNLKRGVSTYWNAKSHEYLCKNDIRIVSVFPDLFPYVHANNREWFYNKDLYFNFVIIDNDAHLQQLLTIFTSETQVVQEGNTRILLTLPFRYDTLNNKLIIVGDG